MATEFYAECWIYIYKANLLYCGDFGILKIILKLWDTMQAIPSKYRR